MSNKNSNFPTNQLNNLPAGTGREVATKVQELRRPQVQTDQEFEARVSEYLQVCVDSDLRPGIESLCLFCGISRQTLNNWVNGKNCTERRQKAAQTAKQAILAGLEVMNLSGKLNPASAIFYLKNWAGYTDSVQIETKQPEPERIRTVEEIQREYMAQAPGVPVMPPDVDFATED